MNHKKLLEEVTSITDDPSACWTFWTSNCYVIDYNWLKICPWAARAIEHICHTTNPTKKFLEEQIFILMDYLVTSNNNLINTQSHK